MPKEMPSRLPKLSKYASLMSSCVHSLHFTHSLFGHPELFSYSVNASEVDALLPSESTSKDMIAATEVPTVKFTPINDGHLNRKIGPLTVDEYVEQIQPCEDARRSRADNSMTEQDGKKYTIRSTS